MTTYRRKHDTDNTYARVKALVDGMKGIWFQDDDEEHLKLDVAWESLPKDSAVNKATFIRLEPEK
jgi:hypothetical protein